MAINMDLTAPIFDIQTYSIHDGPGIRTTVFVKGCPLRCLWCHNPESNKAKSELMWYKSKCTGCGRCVKACPQGAISVTEGNCHTDRQLCNACGSCIDYCYADAREIKGKKMTVAEVVEIVEGEKMFYDCSGGGVTISGGEAMVYPDFCASVYAACKKSGIHTAIETCGYAQWDAVEKILEHVDLVLFDLKHMNSAEHKRLVGVSNELILENAKKICHELKKTMIIRIPVIPTCNDSKENIAATARFVAEELDKEYKVHLLPYHKMGLSKLDSLEKDRPDADIEVPSDEHMNELKQLMETYGLSVQIGG